MSASKKFRDATVGVIALSTIAGCASPSGPMAVGEVRAIGVPLLNDNVMKEELTHKVKVTTTGPGCSTCPTGTKTTEISEQVLVRDGGVFKKVGEVAESFGTAAGMVLTGAGNYYNGKGADKYGEGAKNGKLQPLTNIDSHDQTTLGQTATQSPTLSNEQKQIAQGGAGGMGGTGGMGGAGGGGGSAVVGVTATGGSTGPVSATGGSTGPISNQQGQQQGQVAGASATGGSTGPVSATGGSTGPVSATGGSTGPVSATGGNAQQQQGQQSAVQVVTPSRPMGPQ